MSKILQSIYKNGVEYDITKTLSANLDTVIEELNNLEIPDKTSDLINDVPFLTSGDVETKSFSAASENVHIEEVGDVVAISVDKPEDTETCKVNGLKQTSGMSIYAPYEMGSDNTVLMSSGGAFTWQELETKEFSGVSGITIREEGNKVIISSEFQETETCKVNGLKQTSGMSIYAPEEMGSANTVLMSDGSDFEWKELENKKLSGVNDIDISESGDTILISSKVKSVKLSAGTNIEFETDADGNLVINSTASGSSETAKINNKVQQSGDSYFALTSVATESGKTVVSDENGLPVWGETMKAKKLSAGTNIELDISGDTITISSKGGETATVNTNPQTDTMDIVAPVGKYGTSGQVLTSMGENTEPEWKTHIEIVPLTKAQYSALTTDEKNDATKMYNITDDTVPVWKTFLDMMYPVGSVYISVTGELPTLFTSGGATWTKVADGNSLWTSSSDLGQSSKGSLPNIKGSMHGVFTYESTGNDAISGRKENTSTGGGSSNYHWTTYNFNASSYNDVYTGDATNKVVKPTAINVSMWIRTA